MADKEKDQDLKTSKEEATQTKQPAEDKSKKEAAKKVDPKDKEIADLKQKSSDLEDNLLRSQAEMQNMTKRHNKEVADILKYDGQKLATEILPVLDNLERALQVEADDDASKQLKKGIEMVHEHMVKALENNHVTAIDNEGEKFDPTLSQAVQTVPADDKHAKDTVVSVLQKGYKLEDRVLRPAMVVVAQ
ncbi:nucleotide exchange factor GrpE [Companilactobacillus sp. FL22-1]|uniref:nucleotide exchange factor GrpE n=1 Tax=Companilactobacillus sp. FL22-1 TaxID=3373892 RepID=UPI0037546C21